MRDRAISPPPVAAVLFPVNFLSFSPPCRRHTKSRIVWRIIRNYLKNGEKSEGKRMGEPFHYCIVAHFYLLENEKEGLFFHFPETNWQASIQRCGNR